MQYRPCRLVGVQPEGALQAEGRHLIFWVTSCHATMNQIVSGVRVRSNGVLAVVETRLANAWHIQRPSPMSQPPLEPHFGQVNQFDHRSQFR